MTKLTVITSISVVYETIFFSERQNVQSIINAVESGYSQVFLNWEGSLALSTPLSTNFSIKRGVNVALKLSIWERFGVELRVNPITNYFTTKHPEHSDQAPRTKHSAPSTLSSNTPTKHFWPSILTNHQAPSPALSPNIRTKHRHQAPTPDRIKHQYQALGSNIRTKHQDQASSSNIRTKDQDQASGSSIKIQHFLNIWWCLVLMLGPILMLT